MNTLKTKIRKKLGFYYRFIKTYYQNRVVFKNVLNLDAFPLTYSSVLSGESIPESRVKDGLLSGDIIVVRNLIESLNLQAHFEKVIEDSFGIKLNDLERIHKIFDVATIVQQALTVRRDVSLLSLQTSIINRLMKPLGKSVYAELQPNLRLHLPYRYVKKHEQYIEARLGRGKINPHGQHKDSWRYHPENTINIWLALSEANEKNGLSILPESTGYNPKFDEVLQEALGSVKTYPAQHWVSDLQRGDVVMFSAELLHGSIINTSPQSRVCLSMRSTLGEPVFHRKATTNYIKLEEGRFNNLSISKLRPKGSFEPLSTDIQYHPAENRGTGFVPESVDEKHIRVNIQGRTKVFPRYCPHAGRDLLNGEFDNNGKLLCPSHRMSFEGKDKIG